MKATCNGFCRAHNILYAKSAHSPEPNQGLAEEVLASTHDLEPRWPPTAGEVRHTEVAQGVQHRLCGAAPRQAVPSPLTHDLLLRHGVEPQELFQLCEAGPAQAATGDPHKQSIVGSRLGLPLAITSDSLHNILLCSAICEQRFVASSLGDLLVVRLSRAADS